MRYALSPASSKRRKVARKQSGGGESRKKEGRKVCVTSFFVSTQHHPHVSACSRFLPAVSMYLLQISNTKDKQASLHVTVLCTLDELKRKKGVRTYLKPKTLKSRLWSAVGSVCLLTLFILDYKDCDGHFLDIFKEIIS